MSPVPFAEYLNVRIAGHYSRLLKRSMFEELLGGDSLATLTTYLLDHPGYSAHIEHALEHLPEREGLEKGIAAYFTQCITDLYDMSEGRLREHYTIVLYSFELRNLSTIILSRIRNINFHDMSEMLVPCGLFDLALLRPLFEKGTFSDIINYLSVHHPLHIVIRNAYKASNPNEPVINLVNRIEIKALEYIVYDLLKPENKVLREVYRLEIDKKNIVAALKSVWEGDSGIGNSTIPFARGGNVDLKFLNELVQVKSPDEALEMIESTPFSEAIEKGIIYYAETGFLHEMERFFEEVYIKKTQYFRRFDSFGNGPFIGYVWAHYVEMTNLRLIINGIAFKTGAGQIRKGLIYV